MNTQILMIGSAIYFAVLGVLLTFMPAEILESFDSEAPAISVLISQTLGAALLAFGLLNWMTRKNILGGIYGKPLMMANFLFFFATAAAYIKSGDHMLIWILAALSSIFAVSFGYVTFTHPFKKP